VEWAAWVAWAEWACNTFPFREHSKNIH